MNDIKKLKEQQKDKHPGFSSYLDCMSRALLTGLAGFALTFSASYIGQTLLQKRLPYSRNAVLLVSSVLATGVSYKVTSDRTKACQAAWMAAEDKHTYLKAAEL